MKNRPLSGVSRFTVGVLSLCCPVTAFAQGAPPVSPVTVTPPSLAPAQRDGDVRVEIPEAGALRPPAGAEGIYVTLADVTVAGSFPEVSEQVAEAVARLRGRQASLAEIYSVASEVEAIHARAGYVLARVSVPPQNLSSGGSLKIVVTDGFIEEVDVSALPQRIRGPIKARVGVLAGKRHVRMAEIESALMLTGDLPGLGLRSTLMRGATPGGTRLVLEGSQKFLSGSLGVDNQLDPSLGRWQTSLQLSLNSALGFGELIYGIASSGYQVEKFFDESAPERVLGAGMIVPLSGGHLTINPEATFVRTVPTPSLGAPASVGLLRRYSLRINETLVRTRRKQIGLGLAVEQADVVSKLPAFDVEISHDRYMAARLGGSISVVTGSGASYGAVVQYSKGLGSLGAITAAEALASSVPNSRVGASTNFNKLNVSLRAVWPMGQGFGFSVNARAQNSFGNPVFRAEQFSMEGPDGLSAYRGGSTAVDAGAVVRAELARSWAMGRGGPVSALSPYGFASVGAGSLAAPTTLERKHISAFNLGGGLRATLFDRFDISVEYARGIADYDLLDKVDRVNVSATLRF